MNEITVTVAQPEEFETVGILVGRLLCELFPGDDEYKDSEKYISAARQLLQTEGNVWALLAKTESAEIVGMLTLNQCSAIYSCGSFGEICELYVGDSERSSGIGAKLIEAAKEFARDKGWPEIEVGAPPQPDWKRSFEFYLKQGFEYVGPRLYLKV